MGKDDYETPDSAWDIVLDTLDKDLVIWEPFWCSGRSGRYIASKGFSVIHEDRDFFQWEPEKYDIIVTNPPYSNKAAVFDRLQKLGKPFCVLVPIITICNRYFSTKFKDCQLLIPQKRVQYLKDGVATKKCNFDSVFVIVGWEMGNVPSVRAL